MGLIFSLFDIASAKKVPLGISQHTQWILNGLISVLLCVPLIFSDNKKCWFGGGGMHGSLLRWKSSVFFIAITLITRELFKQLFDSYCCVSKQIGHSWKWSIMIFDYLGNNWGTMHHLNVDSSCNNYCFKKSALNDQKSTETSWSIVHDIKNFYFPTVYFPFDSRDITALIVLLWFNVVSYSSLFQYFFSIYYGPYFSWKFNAIVCLAV